MVGLSLASNSSAATIIAGISATRTRLENTNGRLASGLRITTPSDDPSGFVIAAKLETRAQAFDTVVQSVQNAHNAVEVASGAIDSIIAVTQRIRALAVEASSTLYSVPQIADIQAEISQLIHEVNAISEQTSFNGVKLLSGPSDVLVPQIKQSSSTKVETPRVGETVEITTSLSTPPQKGNVLIAALSHGDALFGGGGPARIGAPPGWQLVDNQDNGFANGFAIYTHVVTAGETGTYTWGVASFKPGNILGLAVAEIQNANADSPLTTEVSRQDASITPTHPLVTPAIFANATGLLPLAFFNAHGDDIETSTTPGWSTVEYPYETFNGIHVQQHAPTIRGEALQAGVDPHVPGTIDGYAAIALVNPKLISAPISLTTQIGGELGETFEAALQPVNAASLTLANVDVRQSPQTAISSADGALAVLTRQQGELGAFAQALGDFRDQANITSVADTAAYSAIRDANIAHEVSENTRDTILQSYGIALLAQANIAADNVLRLFRPNP